MFAAQDLYPSRVGESEKILDRQDPVVYGSNEVSLEHALSQQQLEFFENNGYLIVPDFFGTDEIKYLKKEAVRLKHQLAGRDELVLEPDSEELRTIFALHQFSDHIREFAGTTGMLDPVKQIIGSDVYIMQSRLNIKPAYKGKSFPWHSDFETWHVEDGMPRMRAVTAWVMLSENNEYNGPLYVVPGSHKKYVSCAGTTGDKNYKQSLRKQVLGVPKPESIDDLIRDHGVQGIYGKPGTLVLHDCNVLHGSPDNISPWPREILMFVYNSTENMTQQPFSGLEPRPEYLADRDPLPLGTS